MYVITWSQAMYFDVYLVLIISYLVVVLPTSVSVTAIASTPDKCTSLEIKIFIIRLYNKNKQENAGIDFKAGSNFSNRQYQGQG